LLFKQQKNLHPFYTRVQNTTEVTFTQQETELWSKGLQYDPHFKHKNWIGSLALVAETAVSRMNVTDQEYMRQLINKNLTTLIKNNNTTNDRKAKQEWNIIKRLKQKTEGNNIITQPDKGKPVLIMQKEQHQTKVTESVHSNNLTPLNQDPTPKFQRKIISIVNQCKDTVP
jgi:hypothetical protein